MGPEGADGKGRQGTNAFPTQLRSEPQAELRKHRRDRMIRAEMVKGKKKDFKKSKMTLERKIKKGRSCQYSRYLNNHYKQLEKNVSMKIP